MKKGTSKKKTTKKSTALPADRALAAERAQAYRLIIAPHPKGGYVGRSFEMPLVFGSGPTEQACIDDTRATIIRTIMIMLEHGQTPPAPAEEGKRDVQFNLRLTADERMRIAERARQAGFSSIADYIRRAALRGVA